MVYIHLTDSKGLLVILWMITSHNTAATIRGNIQLNNKTILNNFLKTFVKPYIITVKTPEDNKHADKPPFRAKRAENSVTQFIEEKIEQLKPYLQDTDIPHNPDEDKITLEGGDETTIIEILPKMNANKQETEIMREKTQSFKANVEKYKRLRRKIKRALKDENVTNKTKTMVTRTLDEMISQMIANQCTWVGNPATKGTLRTKNNVESSLTNNWDQLWEKLKREYVNPLPENSGSQTQFLKKFQDLMNMMNTDLKKLVNKYKVVCHLIDTDSGAVNKNILRNEVEHQQEQKVSDLKSIAEKEVSDLKSIAEKEMQGHNLDEKLPCERFKICSDELRDFMTDFYVNLNDTAISTITNYAAMFLRDVSDDGYHEKERIVGLINKTAKALEDNVTEIFKKQLMKFKVDRMNNYANVRNLNKLVSKIVQHVKLAMHNNIPDAMKTVREKLMQNIQKDIDVNADVDLGNLEREISNRICPSFEVCNGRVFSNVKRREFLGPNNVFVKVQLEVDTNKPAIVRRATDMKFGQETTYKTFRVIWTRSPLQLNVTRTAPRSHKLLLNVHPSLLAKGINKLSDTGVLKVNNIDTDYDMPYAKPEKRSKSRKKYKMKVKQEKLKRKSFKDILKEMSGTDQEGKSFRK